MRGDRFGGNYGWFWSMAEAHFRQFDFLEVMLVWLAGRAVLAYWLAGLGSPTFTFASF